MKWCLLLSATVLCCAPVNYNMVVRDVSTDAPLEAVAQRFALAGEPPQFMSAKTRHLETRWFVTGTPAPLLDGQVAVYVRRFEAQVGTTEEQRPAARVKMRVLTCVEVSIVVRERRVDGKCEEVSYIPKVLERDFQEVLSKLNQLR